MTRSKNLKSLPVLYSFRRCPYAIRARLALNVSAIKVELREVLLRDKAAEFILTSPKATVPVLVDEDGKIYEESLDIMDWALQQNDPEGWLSPQIGNIDEMRALIDQCENEFKPHLDRYKYANRYENVDQTVERHEASKYLWQLDQHLAKHSHLFGSRISLADMAIIPFVRQFANVERRWFDNCQWQNLVTWLVEFLQSEKFPGIMVKYKTWKVGDQPVIFGED